MNLNLRDNNNLENWKNTGQYFNHQGNKIFFQSTINSNHNHSSQDSKPTLLLIHGFPTSSWDWHKIWFDLSTHYDLIALDMLGFGFSDKPIDARYLIKDQADIQEALLQHLNINNYHILAHDYGDTVTQELLARNSHSNPRISSVIFLNGGLFPETHRPLFIQKLLISPMGFLLCHLMTKKKFKASLQSICNQPLNDDELKAFWQQIKFNNGHKVFNKLIRYMRERKIHRARWLQALKNGSIPMALINGSSDPISGSHMVARYRELIRHEHIYEIPEAGHYPQIETPQQVLEAILSFNKAYPASISDQ